MQDSEFKDHLKLIHFDYHQNVSSSSKSEKLESILYKQTGKFISEHNFFHKKRGIVISKQTGTIRTNCMDCLDRTNAVQTFHSSKVLQDQLQALDIDKKFFPRFQEVFKTCWKNNGDNLSWIYAGSGAQHKSSKLKDKSRSVQRAFQSKFNDSSKQEAINKLLFSHAFEGELGRQTRALLSPTDAYS